MTMVEQLFGDYVDPEEMQELIKVCEYAELEEERTRSKWSQSQVKPYGYKKTFFAQTDLWQFIPEWDEKQCDTCGNFALGVPFFSGIQIRSVFPNWEYSGDEDMLYPVVHPNCRCELHRVIEGDEDKVLSPDEAKDAFVHGEL